MRIRFFSSAHSIVSIASYASALVLVSLSAYVNAETEKMDAMTAEGVQLLDLLAERRDAARKTETTHHVYDRATAYAKSVAMARPASRAEAKYERSRASAELSLVSSRLLGNVVARSNDPAWGQAEKAAFLQRSASLLKEADGLLSGSEKNPEIALERYLTTAREIRVNADRTGVPGLGDAVARELARAEINAAIGRVAYDSAFSAAPLSSANARTLADIMAAAAEASSLGGDGLLRTSRLNWDDVAARASGILTADQMITVRALAAKASHDRLKEKLTNEFVSAIGSAKRL